MHEYRVLAQSDSFWRDRFSPAALEKALNELAQVGWRAIAITSTEYTGLGGIGTKRHEMLVVLEREATSSRPTKVADPDGYDASRIPADRWYRNLGNVTTRLKQAGAIDDAALSLARTAMASRGGHICDHLLALGLVDEQRLRDVVGPRESTG